jgi:hypothetical protein
MKTGKEERKEVKKVEKKEESWCPYCEDETANAKLPYCQPCQVTTFNCPSCGKPAPRTKRICPSCGAKMKPGA